MHAYLADTGFAKAAQAQRGGLSLSPISPPYLPHISPISPPYLQAQRGGLSLSSRRGPCYTPGYADPIIINGGEYSAV